MAASINFQTRVVGWKNKQEFKDIYDCLFDKNEQRRRDGLERISAWKCRFADKMPVAIECTATLLEATLMEGNEKEPSRLQLIYSMAVIRFVNLITGYLQNKAQAQPVVALAKEINLPEWLVELRHEASHKHMPPLSVLRLAAKVGLTWLRENFWEKQCAGEASTLPRVEEELVYAPNINGVEDDIRRLSISYQQAQYQHIQSGNRSDSSGVTEIISDLEGCLSDPEARYLLMSLLLQDGYLVPTTEQLQALHITEGFVLVSVEDIVYELECISYNDGTVCIHRVLCQLWKPLIMLLHSLELTPLLLQHIIMELGKFRASESTAADYLMGWAMQIIMAATTDRRMYRAHQMLFRESLQLPWNQLFDECTKHPSRFTLGLLQYILPNVRPPLSEQAQMKIKHLSTVYCNAQDTHEAVSTTHNGDDSTLRIYTMEDIARLEGGDCQGDHRSPDEQSTDVDRMDVSNDVTTQSPILKERDHFQPWSASTADVDWSKIPIGSLPGQPDDPNYLVLDIPQSDRRKQQEPSVSRCSISAFALDGEPAAQNRRLKPTITRQEPAVKKEVHLLPENELENIKRRICVF